jgi:Calx-beta domain
MLLRMAPTKFGRIIFFALIATLIVAAGAVTVIVDGSPSHDRASAAGFKPDASNTGYRVASLTQLSGDRTASGMGIPAGGTISGVHITGKLLLDRANVHVVDSWVEQGIFPTCCGAGSAGAGAFIEYTEIGPRTGNGAGEAVGEWGYTLSHVNIHNVSDGPRANGDVLIEFSFIHDLVTLPGDHNDAIQATSLDGSVTIRGNTIWNQNGQTSAIMIGADTGSISNGDLLIENNFLAGGGWTLYGGAPAKPHSEIIRNNIFERRFFANVGQFGPVAYLASNVVWQNNIYDDGSPVGGAADTSTTAKPTTTTTKARTPAVVVPSIRVDDISVKEGNSGSKQMRFRVWCSVMPTSVVTVHYETRNGTATTPSDYTAKSGTLTFKPRKRVWRVAVPIMGDRTPEANETVTLRLSSPSGATVADGTGFGTIVNND